MLSADGFPVLGLSADGELAGRFSMGAKIEWIEFPLTGFTHTIPVSDGDVAAMVSLFPDCDPSKPPWKDIEAELLSAGYHLYDIMNIRCRRVLLMLREARAAAEPPAKLKIVEKFGRPESKGVAKRRKNVYRLHDQGHTAGEIASKLLEMQRQHKLPSNLKVGVSNVESDIKRRKSVQK